MPLWPSPHNLGLPLKPMKPISGPTCTRTTCASEGLQFLPLVAEACSGGWGPTATATWRNAWRVDCRSLSLEPFPASSLPSPLACSAFAWVSQATPVACPLLSCLHLPDCPLGLRLGQSSCLFCTGVALRSARATVAVLYPIFQVSGPEVLS